MRWSWFRIAAAVLALSGIVAGFIVNIDRASREHQDLELVLVNYFSLFTIVSSLLSVIALVAAASWAQRHPGTTREPLSVALGLAAVAGPVLLLGIVYNILLRETPSGVAQGDAAGSLAQQHVVDDAQEQDRTRDDGQRQSDPERLP